VLSKRNAKLKDKQNERREAKKALKEYLRGRPIHISEGPNREQRRMRPARYSLLWEKIITLAKTKKTRIRRRDYTRKQLSGLYSRLLQA
jgi:hypothetical protein